MTKRKSRVEVLHSKDPQLALDRLAEAVARRISDKELKAKQGPESDEALTESVLMQPWCLPREIALAIRRLIPVWHWEKYSWVYADHGCWKRERKDVPHASLGMCNRSHAGYTQRLKASIVRHAGRRVDMAEMKAALTLKEDSAREILAEITAGHAPIAKPTKRLGRLRLGDSRGTGR
jgi:hypothetical protein